jgi:hypothetical protein
LVNVGCAGEKQASYMQINKQECIQYGCACIREYAQAASVKNIRQISGIPYTLIATNLDEQGRPV